MEQKSAKAAKKDRSRDRKCEKIVVELADKESEVRDRRSEGRRGERETRREESQAEA